MKNEEKLRELCERYNKINEDFLRDTHEIFEEYLTGLRASIDKFKSDLKKI
jgi:hypothetical protein